MARVKFYDRRFILIKYIFICGIELINLCTAHYKTTWITWIIYYP
ncbi:hypothetical protein SAMN05428975_3674 [Mucilaginibacter sp. OK268]|jgi:hypothetical protein|nr:hypothetical protein SAMN05428975_3674 [Mucilaginibacter sp. OK268]